MKPRFKDINQLGHATKAMLALQKEVEESGLEPGLVELVKMRASQINGCAYCLNMHFQDAKASGETDQRLYLLDAWREAPVYTERERAALAWTEAVTLITVDRVSDEVFALARQHFSESELANLTLAVVAINGWNRFNVAFRNVPPVSKAATTSHARANVEPAMSK
jgi:AhpD family alkylhydroperoxidase